MLYLLLAVVLCADMSDMEEEEGEEGREAGAAAGKAGARAETYDEGTGGYDVSWVLQATYAVLYDSVLAVVHPIYIKHSLVCFFGGGGREHALRVGVLAQLVDRCL